jgi:hypothetical protein
MQSTPTQGRTRSRVVWIGLIFIVTLLAAAAIWKSARSAAAMSAGASTDEMHFTQVAPDTKTKVVIEVAEVAADGTVRGKLLQKKTEETYARTSTKVTAHLGERTAMVMGKREDVHAKAVVHITGTVRDDHSIDAEQIVIISGYVQVE